MNPNDPWLTPDRLSEIRERLEKATPGPWMRSGVRQKLKDEDCIMVGPDGFSIAALPIGNPRQHAGAFTDADFIAHARSDIPFLLDELTRLREALKYIADLDKHGGYNTACHHARAALEAK